jgi:hypothetical protein
LCDEQTSRTVFTTGTRSYGGLLSFVIPNRRFLVVRNPYRLATTVSCAMLLLFEFGTNKRKA